MSVYRGSVRVVAAVMGLMVGTGVGGAQVRITTGSVSVKTDTVPVDTTRKDIVATVAAAGNYKTFAKLLEAANLTSTLQGSAEFTVFAPTDEAFARVPAGKMAALQADTAQLKKLLLYHVVSGRIRSNKILNLKNARTLSGGKVEFSVKDARLRVNGAVIVQPDIKASNGVVHGIDSVLMP